MANFGLMILFIFFSLGIIYGAHYFIYFSLVKFFAIESGNLKISLAVAFFVLPIFFVISSILIRYFHNVFANSLYFLSSLWLGIATTLFFLLVSAWLVYGLARLAHLPINLQFVGILVLVFTLVFSVYGVWSAYHPRIKEIKVAIKNLPTEWQGKKVIQISDVHLGHVLSKNFFEKLIAQINAQNPEAVFVTGDLFDGMGDGFEYVAEEIDKISAPSGVFFVTGNHETYFGLDNVYKFLNSSKIKIFHNDLVNLNGLQIIGINYPDRFAKIDLKKTIGEVVGFDPAKPSILLFHTPFDILSVKESGISLELCGHTHGGQIFPGGIITNLIYHGYDRGLHVEGDFSQYTSVGAGVWGPTMRTFAQPEIVVIDLERKP